MRDAFPTYLLLGMTPEQYWKGDVRLVVAYREADRLRRNRASIDRWEAGLYVMAAIASAFVEENEYPAEPLSLKLTREELHEREQRRMLEDLARMEAYAASINAKIGEGA